MSSIAWTDESAVVGVDLYQTDDYVRFRRVDLVQLLKAVFTTALGQPLDGAEFVLSFHAVADRRQISGAPTMVNLRQSHSFVTVRIIQGSEMIYRHPHSVREILARPLQRLLAEQMPDVEHWGFAIAGPGMERFALERPTPRAEGSVDLRIDSVRPRRFHVEQIPEPQLAVAGLVDFGVSDASRSDDQARVVFASEAHGMLMHTTPFSSEVEEGGFLVGRVFQDRDASQQWLVHVTHAWVAERTGASLLQFTFTGESFLRVNDAIARLGNDLRLIGWYHTHLFAATDWLGLSSIDVDLHTRTFLRPWQVAGLLNLADGTRTLRTYGWDGARMRQLPYCVATR